MWEQSTQYGEWESVSSPLPIPDYLNHAFFALVAYEEKGILPNNGGLFDQQNWFLDAVKLMRMANRMANERAEKVRERNEKRNKKV